MAIPSVERVRVALRFIDGATKEAVNGDQALALNPIRTSLQFASNQIEPRKLHGADQAVLGAPFSAAYSAMQALMSRAPGTGPAPELVQPLAELRSSVTRIAVDLLGEPPEAVTPAALAPI